MAKSDERLRILGARVRNTFLRMAGWSQARQDCGLFLWEKEIDGRHYVCEGWTAFQIQNHIDKPEAE